MLLKCILNILEIIYQHSVFLCCYFTSFEIISARALVFSLPLLLFHFIWNHNSKGMVSPPSRTKDFREINFLCKNNKYTYIYIYIYGHFRTKVPLFPKFESSPGSLLLNTVTQILVVWKIIIQCKILDGKHIFFSVFCPQISAFKKWKKCMFFMSFMNHFFNL